MKFKDSRNWGNYPVEFEDEQAIDIVGTMLLNQKNQVEKVVIRTFKDEDRTYDDIKVFEKVIDPHYRAMEYIENLELTDVDDITIIFDTGIEVFLDIQSDTKTYFWIGPTDNRWDDWTDEGFIGEDDEY